MARAKLTFELFQDDGTTPIGAAEIVPISTANTVRLQATIDALTTDNPVDPVTGTALEKFRKLTVKWWVEQVNRLEERADEEAARATVEAARAARTNIDA